MSKTSHNIEFVTTGSFNIRDCFWDSSYLYYSSHKDTLFKTTDSFHIELSKPTEFFPTRYSDNVWIQIQY